MQHPQTHAGTTPYHEILSKIFPNDSEEQINNKIDALSHNDNMDINEFKRRLTRAAYRVSLHDLIVMTSKLGAGAFSWQLIFLLMTKSLGKSYVNDLTNGDTAGKVGVWFATGAAAAVFLITMMLSVQLLLSSCFHGLPAKRFVTVAMLLCLSVSIADGMWQPLNDLYKMIFRAMGSDTIAGVVGLFAYVIFCLLESFTFRFLNNSLDRYCFERLNNCLNACYPVGEQIRFVCDNEFTTILWSAYFGFYALPHLFYTTTGIEVENVVLSSLIASLGAALLPLLIGWGNHVERLVRTQKACSAVDVENQSRALSVDNNTMGVSLLSAAETTDTNRVNSSQCIKNISDFVGNYRFNTPVVLFSRAMNATVAAVDSFYIPRCLK